MATTSFDKSFVVKDKHSIDQLQKDLANPRRIKVKKRNYKTENKRGVGLLKQRLSNFLAQGAKAARVEDDPQPPGKTT